MVKLNEQKCEQVGLVLSSLKAPLVVEVKSEANESELLKSLLVMSICHNINHDKHLRAWGRFIETHPDKFNAEYLQNLSSKEYGSWFEGLDEDRVRAEERTAFVRDICEKLVSNYSGSVKRLVDESFCKLGGPSGLLNRLDLFDAYSEDPVRKKSAAFLSDLMNQGMAQFDDLENAPPAVDYHVVRMFTRLGVVDVGDLLAKMKGKEVFTLEEDTSVRVAVSGAAKLMSTFSNLKIPQQSFILWQIGRSCCARFKVCCSSCVSEKCTFTKQTPNSCKNKCLFSDICDNKEEGLSIREPMIRTTYY